MMSHPQIQTIKSKLMKAAKERSIPYDRMMTLFLLERAAVRLTSDSEFSKHLVFKGGYVSVRIYNSARHTTDIDAVLKGVKLEDAAKKLQDLMKIDFNDGVWFQYQGSQELKAQGEYGGLRLSFRSGLGEQPKNLNKTQSIHLDLGIGDRITPSPIAIETPMILGDGSISWWVYPAETIIAEKVHALVTRGAANSRAKDIYDIYILLPSISPETFKQALDATFSYRKDAVPKSISAMLKSLDTSLLARSWSSAISGVQGSPDFGAFFEQITLRFEEMGI